MHMFPVRMRIEQIKPGLDQTKRGQQHSREAIVNKF